jgi:hypothetical protein
MGVMKKHQPVVKKKSESHEGAAEVSSPAEGESAFPSSGVTILDGTDVVGSDAPENVLVVQNRFRNDLMSSGTSQAATSGSRTIGVAPVRRRASATDPASTTYTLVVGSRQVSSSSFPASSATDAKLPATATYSSARRLARPPGSTRPRAYEAPTPDCSSR